MKVSSSANIAGFVVATVLASASGVACAQGYGHGHGDDHRPPAHGAPSHDGHGPHGPVHGHPVYHGPVHHVAPAHRYASGPARGWHRGEYVPTEWRDRQYVIDRWQDYHLSRPPVGYEWLQVDGSFVLSGVNTGVVLNVVIP